MDRWSIGLALCAGAALAICTAQSAFALDPRYPDWPCQQLKVPEISLASVWAGPAIEGADKTPTADAKEADFVSRLAARRTPIEDAQKLIDEFVVGTSDEKRAKAVTLFAALFSTLNAQRGEVMRGIERFSRKQKALAEEIREKTRKMQALQDAPQSDQAEIDALVSQVTWETRIFEDRRKSTSYVCEVPVIIEKRLFDLGRAIQSAAAFDPLPK